MNEYLRELLHGRLFLARGARIAMRHQLITLLRAVPFRPFKITLKTHEVYPIEDVERLAIGKELFCVVDENGTLKNHGFAAVARVEFPKA